MVGTGAWLGSGYGFGSPACSRPNASLIKASIATAGSACSQWSMTVVMAAVIAAATRAG